MLDPRERSTPVAAMVALFAVLALLASACSDGAVPSDETDAAEEPAGSGAIAIAALDGLSVVSGDGGSSTVVTDANPVAQPTWSRDGSRLLAVEFTSPTDLQTVVVAGEEDAVTHPARRPYFFFSWSGDGSFVAGLGPGPGGTTLDILDSDGRPVSDDSLDAGSFYLAWEPGGDDLLIHRDATLELVRDPTKLEDRSALGQPGQLFLAPAWIPGTRDALIAAPTSDGNRLVRIDVDTGEQTDLGPVSGGVGIVVSPDGSRAVLAHGGPAAAVDSIAISFPAQQSTMAESAVTASTEIIDLVTNDRSPVSSEPSLWAEWSPDSESILMLQARRDGEPGSEWVVWVEGRERPLGPSRLSQAFFRNFVPFSWQFVETPRLWSPGSDAIVYGGSDGTTPGIYVHRLAQDSPERIADGDVAFWSP